MGRLFFLEKLSSILFLSEDGKFAVVKVIFFQTSNQFSLKMKL